MIGTFPIFGGRAVVRHYATANQPLMLVCGSNGAEREPSPPDFNSLMHLLP